MRTLRGVATLSMMIVNTLLYAIPLCSAALVRLITPSSAHPHCTRFAMKCAEGWISNNNRILDLLQALNVECSYPQNLHPEQWYLVLCNHQSWTDILILQRLFNKRIPMLKFFIKQSLIYVPILGACWWALDFPIMKRYAPAALRKKPHLRGRDLATTRRSCERFKLAPVSVLNFVEGTRFSHQKKMQSNSPFQHLLKPKSGGVAMVVDALDEQLTAILDVTIIYHEYCPSFWTFLSGHAPKISVKIDSLPVPHNPTSDTNDAAKSSAVQVRELLAHRWLEKDATIQRELLEQS